MSVGEIPGCHWGKPEVPNLIPGGGKNLLFHLNFFFICPPLVNYQNNVLCDKYAHLCEMLRKEYDKSEKIFQDSSRMKDIQIKNFSRLNAAP